MGGPRLGRRRRRDGDGDLGRAGPAAADGAHRRRAATARPDVRPLRGAAAAVLHPRGGDADVAARVAAAGAPDQRHQRGRPARGAGVRRARARRRGQARRPRRADRRRPRGGRGGDGGAQRRRSSRPPACPRTDVRELTDRLTELRSGLGDGLTASAYAG